MPKVTPKRNGRVFWKSFWSGFGLWMGMWALMAPVGAFFIGNLEVENVLIAQTLWAVFAVINGYDHGETALRELRDSAPVTRL